MRPSGYSHWTPPKQLLLGLIFNAPVSGLTPDTTYYLKLKSNKEEFKGIEGEKHGPVYLMI